MRKNKLPLFGNESEWVNVDVECDDCGTNVVGYRIKELIDTKPEFECPMCGKKTGQKTTVEVQ